MTRVDSIIADLKEARAATDAYIAKHDLAKKYENPRQEVEDDEKFGDLTADEDSALFTLCEVKYANDNEFFRTIEYLLKVNPRFTRLVVDDILARHLKRRKSFRKRKA